MTPPARTLKSRPVGVMQIAPPGQSQEKEKLVGAQERPASQIWVETLVLKPPRAGVEGVVEEESTPGAPTEEETRVPDPAGARDGGVVAAVTAHAAPENVVLVVQLLESNE